MVAACDRLPSESIPEPALAPVQALLNCTASPGSGIHCAPTSPAAPASRAILGHQGVLVRLASAGTAYDSTAGEFTTHVTVQNLARAVLGAGSGPGVHVFFTSEPVVTDGAGTIEVVADGTETFTGSAQPYFLYSQPLHPLETSQARQWMFRISAGVRTFRFQVLVSADTDLGDATSLEPVGPARVRVDDQIWSGTGMLPPASHVHLENGLVRLRLARELGGSDHGSHLAEGWDRGWQELLTRRYGDWTFVGASILTPATEVEVLVNSDSLVAARWTYGNHSVPPRYGDSAYVYRFSKTVWLRRHDRGYYVSVSVIDTVPKGYTSNEYEVGWGGFNKGGSVSTSVTSFRTDTLQRSTRFNIPVVPEAARFDVDGSTWRRILVPLGPEPMVAGVFNGKPHGIWLHGVGRRTGYGAYLHAAPADVRTSARAICAEAAARAPFPVPQMNVSSCGPAE